MHFLGLTMPSLALRVGDLSAERPRPDCKPRLKLASVARSDFAMQNLRAIRTRIDRRRNFCPGSNHFLIMGTTT
jgi:hypothetical protein